MATEICSHANVLFCFSVVGRDNVGFVHDAVCWAFPNNAMATAMAFDVITQNEFLLLERFHG